MKYRIPSMRNCPYAQSAGFFVFGKRTAIVGINPSYLRRRLVLPFPTHLGRKIRRLARLLPTHLERRRSINPTSNQKKRMQYDQKKSKGGKYNSDARTPPDEKFSQCDSKFAFPAIIVSVLITTIPDHQIGGRRWNCAFYILLFRAGVTF